jgi:hypothetical protein
MECMLMMEKKILPCPELPWITVKNGVPSERVLVRQVHGDGYFYTFGTFEMPSIAEPNKYVPMFLFFHSEHDNKCHDIAEEDRDMWDYIDLRPKTEYVFA